MMNYDIVRVQVGLWVHFVTGFVVWYIRHKLFSSCFSVSLTPIYFEAISLYFFQIGGERKTENCWAIIIIIGMTRGNALVIKRKEKEISREYKLGFRPESTYCSTQLVYHSAAVQKCIVRNTKQSHKIYQYTLVHPFPITNSNC